MQALVCPKCGATLVPDDPLCNQCGAPVWSSDAPNGKKSGKRRILYWTAGCAGALVLGLIALRLLLIAVASKVVSQRSAQDTARNELDELAIALDRYAANHDSNYPEDLRSLLLAFDGHGKPFFNAAHVRDPWDRYYRYESEATGQRARVFTLGADGKVGGTGDDTDVERVLTARPR